MQVAIAITTASVQFSSARTITSRHISSRAHYCSAHKRPCSLSSDVRANLPSFVSSGALPGVVKRTGRAVTFWGQVLFIWATFKLTQIRVSMFRHRRSDEWVSKVWHKQHEYAGNLMWNMCSNLRAFYAKAGQIVAMQGFVPDIIRDKLSRLQDDMPPLPGNVARELIEAELKKKNPAYNIDNVFRSIELDSVLGCASIAQVHKGILRERNVPVAIKVQLPDSELLMGHDLGNFRVLAKILQHTELKFDLEGPINELTKQLSEEFDFENEARSMNAIRGMLRGVKGVRIPEPVSQFVTRKLLVMEYLHGLPLTRIQAHVTGKRAMKFAGRRIVDRMSQAYGEMILTYGFFQADSHPGNVLVLNQRLDIGILDFGQTKILPDARRLAFAQLVDAMDRRHGPEVASAMSRLGIVIVPVQDKVKNIQPKRRKHDQETKASSQMIASALAVAKLEESNGDHATSRSKSLSKTGSQLTSSEMLAYTMFDTAECAGVSSNPFSENSALRTATVKELPEELFFLLRTVQIIRGICAATGNSDYSVTTAWAPTARRALHVAERRRKP